MGWLALAVVLAASGILGYAWVQAKKSGGVLPQEEAKPEPEAAPFDVRETVKDWAEARKLSSALVLAVISKESNFKVSALGSVGEVGLMQIRPDTALKEFNSGAGKSYTAQELFNPEVNIEVGTWYLAWIRDTIEKSLKRPAIESEILQAYNGGIGNFLRRTVSAAAQRYATDVISRKADYA